MWECPDFYPLSLRGNTGVDTSQYGDGFKHVLKNSLDATRYEYYTVGTYYREKDRYVPDMTSADDQSGLRYDYGNFYASKTFYDSGKNRRILWGWSNETDSVKDDVTKGWSGIQCGSERTTGRRMRSFSSLTSSPMGIWLLLFEVYHAGIRNPRAASLAFSGGGITGDPGSNSPLIQQYIAHSPFQLLQRRKMLLGKDYTFLSVRLQ